MTTTTTTTTAAAAAAATMGGAPMAATPDDPSPLLALLEQHGLSHCARRQQQQAPAPLHAAATLGPIPLPPRPPRLEGKAVALLAGNVVAGAAGGRPVVAVARAGDRIDLCKLARHLRVQRRVVRIASRRECLAIFGYAPGTVPPIGHGPRTTVVVDFRLGGQPWQPRQPEQGPDDGEPPIIFGAGDDQLELALTFSQLLAVAGRDAAVADVADAAAAAVPPPLLVPTAPSSPLPSPSADEQEADGAGVLPLRPLAAPPKFLIDSMCGRLGRWLRCLGLDALSLDAAIDRVLSAGEDEAVARAAAATATAMPPPLKKASPSAELVAAQRRRGLRLAVAELHARREGRVLLTRDAQLATSREGLTFGAFLLASDECVVQLAELASHFGRDLLASGVGGGDEGAEASSSLLTRCSVCNSAAYVRIGRDEARSLVPARALAAVEAFWRCDDCARVVWWGPKSDRAVSDIRRRVAQALALLDARERRRGCVVVVAGGEAGGGGGGGHAGSV